MYLAWYQDCTSKFDNHFYCELIDDHQLDNLLHLDAGGVIRMMDWREIHDEKSVFRVIVAGSRGFSDFKLMCESLDYFLQHYEHVVIVSGTAEGADKLGEEYAQLRGLYYATFPADWYPNGKGPYIKGKGYAGLDRSAGYKRNVQMGDYANGAVLYWDGSSKGTGHMRDICVQKDLPHRIVNF